MNTIVELEAILIRSLASEGFSDLVTISHKMLVGVERLELTRYLSEETRYLRITPVDQLGLAWEFEVLGGIYGSADPSRDFDGRRGGDTNYVVNLVQKWLLALVSWHELAPFEKNHRD